MDIQRFFGMVSHQEMFTLAISMFYGIVIYIYFFDNERHKTPHIHAQYQGNETSFFPKPQVKLIQAWIEIHRASLMADWDLAIQGKSVFPVDPLK